MPIYRATVGRYPTATGKFSPLSRLGKTIQLVSRVAMPTLMVAWGQLMCGCDTTAQREMGAESGGTIQRASLAVSGDHDGRDGAAGAIDLGVLFPGEVVIRTLRLSPADAKSLRRVRCDCDCLQTQRWENPGGKQFLTLTASNQPPARRDTVLQTPIHFDHRRGAKRWTDHRNIRLECLAGEVTLVRSPENGLAEDPPLIVPQKAESL